jgi:hypothetical protein
MKVIDQKKFVRFPSHCPAYVLRKYEYIAPSI